MTRARVVISWVLAAIVGTLSTFTPARAQEPAKLNIAGVRLGFNNVYKLGCWTQLEVVLHGGDEAYTGGVEVITSDPDGVPTSVFTPPDSPVGIVPGQSTATRLFFRPGQDGSALEVRFFDADGKKRASRTFYPAPEGGGEYIPYGRPATNRLVATFGSPRGVSDLVRGETNEDDFAATRVVRIDDAADLPLAWYGYEAIDTLVLSGNQPELYRPLTAGPQRIAALERWVELGGRLVIFCGSSAPELLGPGGPLASLIPGKYDTLATLRESQPIEAFSGAETPVADPEKFRVQVPRLRDVEGRILVFAGPNAANLPLVVRARRGLGEITFVGVDPDAPPLADWPGRVALLRQALQWPADPPGVEGEDPSYGQEEDLIDRLRRALDESFVGVKTAPFALVAMLVIVYILLIGPGDYFFVKRVLRRMELTWLTFPLIVFVVSSGAYWAAYAMKGDQLRVNQVEIVDVDLDTGEARGTVWTHFFSPHVRRYDLGLVPRFGDKAVSEADRGDEPRGSLGTSSRSETLVGWLGSSGYGLDGMQGRRGQTGFFNRGYAFSPALDGLVGLPVQEWSTKTLVGRWIAKLEGPVDAELTGLDDDLLAGHLTNRTGVALEDCILMHGTWAYSLPSLADGAVATIDDSLQPSSVKTTLTADAAVEISPASPPQPATPAARLRAETLDVPLLAKAMMFHDAIGGQSYALAPNRYQSFIDLSRLLKGDQAILLARAAGAGSHWTDGEESLASDQDQRWVYYRFIIPLKPNE